MLAWLRGSPTRSPVFLRLRTSTTFITVTVASAVFTDVFCYGTVVPVLPFALSSRADIDTSRTQTWISIFLAVYGGALLATAPICGWLADRSSSRQLPLLLGLLALGGSTAILCVGNSIGLLAAGRVLQGVSAAVVWVVGLALLVDTVGSEGVGQAMGYVGLSMSLGMLVAPLLGGIVFEQAGYYAVFAMAFGLIALDIVLRAFIIEKKAARRWLRNGDHDPDLPMRSIADDRRGPEIANKNDIPLPVPSETERQPTVTDPQSTSHPSRALEDGTVARTLPQRLASRIPPVIYLLKSRRVLNAVWASTIQATLLTSFDAILPLYVRDTFGWNSVGAGLIFLPIVVASIPGPLIGWLVDKHGPRWYATAGYALACPFLILLRLVDHNSLGQKALLCALLALLGACLTLVLTPMMAEITYAVDATARRRPPGFFGKNGAYAQAYSLFNVAWAAGCLIGPLLAGLVNQAHGWKATTLILGCISLATAVPTAIWTGGSIFKIARARRRDRRVAVVNEA